MDNSEWRRRRNEEGKKRTKIWKTRWKSNDESIDYTKNTSQWNAARSRFTTPSLFCYSIFSFSPSLVSLLLVVVVVVGFGGGRRGIGSTRIGDTP